MSYAGTILRVDLSAGFVSTEDLPKELAAAFIGGRGLASKILSDEVDSGVDPLSPENKLILTTGPLTGTSAPTGGRYMAVTKGPLTGTIASSNSGGFFGAKLKSAGYDMVILEGKAATPVYLAILDSGAEIRDASDLWGQDVPSATDAMVEACGDSKAKVACIGPAGEKQVLFAAIINDKGRAAGRTGVGAVMGSKNLKGVVVSTARTAPKPMDADAFKDAIKVARAKIKEDPVTSEGLPTFGTKVLDNIINSSGLYPTENFRKSMFDGVEEVSGEALVEKGYLTKRAACFACPIACGRRVTLPNGRTGEGPEYETGWAYGAACGVNDLIAVTEANFLCNELGIDTISAGVTIATAMELYEEGLITRDELGKGPELKFGSSEAIVYYTRAMGLREGIGDKLALGAYRLAESYGRPELAMVVKKQELPAYDPRGSQGQGLAYATSNRGGCHVRAYMISPEILAHPEKLDPLAIDGKAEWTKVFQDLTAVIDSCGVCLFTSFALGADEYNALINADTGGARSVDELMQAGERVWNLERQFNLAAGIGADQDTLPPRLLGDPVSEGPNKGQVARVPEMLPAYYEIRGWTTDGVPTPEKLAELGLC